MPERQRNLWSLRLPQSPSTRMTNGSSQFRGCFFLKTLLDVQEKDLNVERDAMKEQGFLSQSTIFFIIRTRRGKKKQNNFCEKCIYIHTHTHTHIYIYTHTHGDRGGTVVKVLSYKSEGHCFDSRWCQWNFPLT
jgi:hypothetical protein